MVFEDSIPLLQLDLLWRCTSLSSDQLLEVAHSVVRRALDPDWK